jgi:hypothetical protein
MNRPQAFWADRILKTFIVTYEGGLMTGEARGHISVSFHLQRSNKGPVEISRPGAHDRTITPNPSKICICGYMILHAWYINNRAQHPHDGHPTLHTRTHSKHPLSTPREALARHTIASLRPLGNPIGCDRSARRGWPARSRP